MSILAHILTSYVVQAKGCTLNRDNPYVKLGDLTDTYVVGGGCETLIIPPTMCGATNIFELVDRWLADNAHCSAPLVGVWADTDNDSIHVDMSTLVYGLSDALALATARGEKAIWDMRNGVEIKVPSGITWRELIEEIKGTIPNELMDTPAYVWVEGELKTFSGITPNIFADKPISKDNPPSLDLMEEN